jgi:choline dehydrogenase-like flavoprotein
LSANRFEPTKHRFDAIVLGTGQAGPVTAARITATDKTVTVIERELGPRG